MWLQERDYTHLTDEERSEWERVRASEVVGKIGDNDLRQPRFREYPKAARHYEHLFPNNYLDIVELEDTERLTTVLESFTSLLKDSSTRERQLLNFINHEHAHFIVASLLKRRFRFGHHEAYLFPEFQLGNSHQVDHLLLGRSSDGYEFVFVELENPYGAVTTKNGAFGTIIRKGLRQVDDWKRWLEARFHSISQTFGKYKRPDLTLPPEFRELDSSRLHFVVVAGRRTDYTEHTRRSRRTALQENGVHVLHYDNLVDAAKDIIGQATY